MGADEGLPQSNASASFQYGEQSMGIYKNTKKDFSEIQSKGWGGSYFGDRKSSLGSNRGTRPDEYVERGAIPIKGTGIVRALNFDY